ncbi:MAG TPA: hypothetical protein VNP93_09580 [Gaiellaceae bacterium]|nr:hypothetical protein [Gaiellaceae bacterium]
MKLRRADRTPPPVLGTIWWSETTGVLEELGRGVGSTSRTCEAARPFESFGHRAVGSVGGERKVTRPSLRIVYDLGEPAVNAPALAIGDAQEEDGREQRMGKGDALAVELDHLRLDRRPKIRVGVGVQRGIEQRHRRLIERGCMDEHLVRLLRQGI